MRKGVETLLQFVPKRFSRLTVIIKLNDISMTIASRILIQCKQVLTILVGSGAAGDSIFFSSNRVVDLRLTSKIVDG